MKEQEIISSWKKGKDYPSFMDESALITLINGYLINNETPRDAIKRISSTAARLLDRDDLEDQFFNAIWKGWICPSTPVWANFGSKRGLPISCFNSHIQDSISGIFETLAEVAKMSQMGGGTSGYFGSIRPRGSKTGIANGVITGKTGGTKPFISIYDATINNVSQGKVRRGNFAAYLDIDHKDIDEFLNIREVGDPIQNISPGVCITDSFIEKLYDGDEKALTTWAKILEMRGKTGMPYIFFNDNVNNGISTPSWYGYKQNNPDLYIRSSNLCTEILEPSNDYWSFVCCLLSLNIGKYKEWKNTNVIQLAIYILDSILTEFIDKTSDIKEMWKARKFAEEHRAVGLGVLGWHSFLQSENIPFNSLMAKSYNRIIFKDLREKAELATYELGEKYEPCNIGDGKRRNSVLLALAPTTTNAIIQGESQSIEPWSSNYFIHKTSKGNFIRKNKFLEDILISIGHNTDEIWESIKKNGGSVQHLDILDDHQKDVFKTFKEINQFIIIEQAAERQQYIDQGQSLNVNIPPDTDPGLISKLYLYAHKLGIKTLYYQRSETILRGGLQEMSQESCVACSG
jgi:ribonucleoside-diphosphate reductase alpha chain